MDFRNMFVACRECDMFHWREHSHLCRVCRRAPVVGRELPTDPFWRACMAIFRRPETPYSLKVIFHINSSVREVREVVPFSRVEAWRIPFVTIERALAGRQLFPFYGEVPEALYVVMESVRLDPKVTPPGSPVSSPITPPSRAPIPRPGLRHG
ncbi:unnamed protein product [Lasius platythorax]|uniref:DUF35 domain-containing protein n=1 Tax=Lasius platythorax TaxID=488582 RepID=A0AAV2MVH2_9HYME